MAKNYSQYRENDGRSCKTILDDIFEPLDMVMPEVINTLLCCTSKFLSVLQFELSFYHFSTEGVLPNTGCEIPKSNVLSRTL